MIVPNAVYNKGSNGLIIGDSVKFIIETRKAKDATDWLFNAAKRYGIMRQDCRGVLGNETPDREVHHLCHAVSAYAQSGFDDASILVIDGMNRPDGISIAIFEAKNGELKERKTYTTEHSLGSYYQMGVSLCGWPNPEWCGRLMGLASYGDQRSINDCPLFFIVDPNTGDVMETGGGRFRAINTEFYSSYYTGNMLDFDGADIILKITNNNANLKEFDFSAVSTATTIQYQFEQSVFSLLEYIYNNLPSRNLVLTGGCALNCVCNGKIIRSGKWDNLFIPNMCEDMGNIIGRMVMELNQKVTKPYIYNRVTYPIPKEWNKTITKEELASKIKNGTIVLWFEGGSEYGPRALCHRSILGDPTLPWMAYRINEIKGRESWRPLAPVVLDTHFKRFFDVDGRIWPPHKTMLVTEYIRPEYQRKLQAVCAPDNSSRPQVLLDIPENHTLYSLMKTYELPILVNTSMNGAGEPICETPEDAIQFASRHKDVLLVFVKNDKIFVRENFNEKDFTIKK